MLRHVFAVLAVVAVPLAACVKDDPCAFGECAGSGTSTVDGGPDADNTIAPPPGCDPNADPKDAVPCVDDSYALFVDRNGSSDNPGTRSAPLPSIGLAVQRHGRRPRIYVCEGTYPEAVPVADAVSIFGGYACGTWVHNGKKALVAAKGDTTPALVVTNVAAPIQIADLAIAGASDAASSVAVLVASSADVTFRRVDMTAADVTVPGANGVNASPMTTRGAEGNSGMPGPAKTCMCPGGGGLTVGGAGGDPAFPGQPQFGVGGGEGGDGTDCAGLGTGKDGKAAPPSEDAPKIFDVGVLDARGWLPRAGDPGPPGDPGQGGGGGGANGGSGGCGGCGANGGGGGAGGGGSIALAVFRSGVRLVESTLRAARAGNGGDGGKGASGAEGGPGGGPGAGAGCPGGRGGRAGESGGGAGGAGGVSAAILYLGAKPEVDAMTTTTSGSAGAAGKGGGAANEGIAGRAEPIIALP